MEQTILANQTETVLTLKLNRPKAFNSFTIPMSKRLQEELKKAADNPSVRAIVITGEGKAFCAGQDLKEATQVNGPSIGEIVEQTYNPLITRIRDIEKPIIASVNGVAAGAGANIALACDIILAAESASFIQAFSSIGLVPDSGGTFFLPRLIGRQRAAAQFFLGDKISAQQAQEMGMIYKAVADAVLISETQLLAQKLAQRPTKAIGLTKRLMNCTMTNSLEEQLEEEKRLQEMAGKTHDNKEGIQAFLEKRKPFFLGQ